MKRCHPLGFEPLDERVLPVFGSLNVLSQLISSSVSSSITTTSANSGTASASSSNAGDGNLANLLATITAALKDAVPDSLSVAGNGTTINATPNGEHHPTTSSSSVASTTVHVDGIGSPLLSATPEVLATPLPGVPPVANVPSASSSAVGLDKVFEQIAKWANPSASLVSLPAVSSSPASSNASNASNANTSGNAGSNSLWDFNLNYSSIPTSVSNWIGNNNVLNGVMNIGSSIESWVSRITQILQGSGSGGPGNSSGGSVVTGPTPTQPSNAPPSATPSPGLDAVGGGDKTAKSTSATNSTSDSVERDDQESKIALAALVRETSHRVDAAPREGSTSSPRPQEHEAGASANDAGARAVPTDEIAASNGSFGKDAPADGYAIGEEESLPLPMFQPDGSLPLELPIVDDLKHTSPQIEESLGSVSLASLVDFRLEIPEIADWVESMDEGFKGWVKDHQIGLSLLAGAGAFWLAQARTHGTKSSRARWLSLVAGHDEVFSNLAIEE